jgi:glycosyltransferase involved in cell wall biosynthesis
MKVLMLAPEPFFEPRGTPISVYFRIMALGALGHSVTLVTYPLGKDISLENLNIIRLPNLLCVRKIKIGPSWVKVPLDILLLFRAAFELAKARYDLVFSHEEAAFIGVILAKLWGKPHIYDMHSSLPQQLKNFEFTRLSFLISLFREMENFILKNSQAVIVICQDLLEKVARLGCRRKAVLIENFLDFPAEEFSAEDIAAKKKDLAPRGEKIVLYAGNFEPYQGIPLLLEAAQKVGENVIFLLVGGSGPSLEEMKNLARKLRLAGRVVFVSKVPPSQIPLYVSIADVLVSPRLGGTNTPLKIYSFLKSGKPLVATNLWTHNQVLSAENAVLVEPDAQSLAEGISFALRNEEARVRAQAAAEWARKEYTLPKYLDKMGKILEKANH